MFAYQSTSHLRLRSAGLLTALTLVNCAPEEQDFGAPVSGGTQAGTTGGSGFADRGGSSASLGGQAGNTMIGAGFTSGGMVTGGAGSAGATPVAEGGSIARGGSGGTSSVAGGGSGGMGPAPACSGKPGAFRGKSNQMLTAAGLARTFVHYAPANLDPNTPAPVVIMVHGWTMSGQQMYDITRYHEIADREGIVVMYPDGQPASLGPWNVGDAACPSSFAILPIATGDDQAFVDAMIAFAAADQCVAREHVFVTGFSMGGYFSNETGCLRSDIAAIGPHSGGSHDFSACPAPPKPAIIFHGTMDGVIPVGCGKQARDRWVQHNGCDSQVENVSVMGGHCEYSKGCPADGQVVLCLFDGMGHGWAGGQGAVSSFPDFESASLLSWEFFKKYAW
jgi:polyhydroxybutyrate depolymerase